MVLVVLLAACGHLAPLATGPNQPSQTQKPSLLVAVSQPEGDPTLAGTGHLRIAIRWPLRSNIRTQTIPNMANSVFLSVSTNSAVVWSTLLTRNAGAPTVTTDVSLRAGQYQLTATAYQEPFPNTNSPGLAGGSATFTIIRSKSTTTTISLTPTSGGPNASSGVSISGLPVVGQTLTANPGTGNGSPTSAFQYFWQRGVGVPTTSPTMPMAIMGQPWEYNATVNFAGGEGWAATSGMTSTLVLTYQGSGQMLVQWQTSAGTPITPDVQIYNAQSQNAAFSPQFGQPAGPSQTAQTVSGPNGSTGFTFAMAPNQGYDIRIGDAAGSYGVLSFRITTSSVLSVTAGSPQAVLLTAVDPVDPTGWTSITNGGAGIVANTYVPNNYDDYGMMIRVRAFLQDYNGFRDLGFSPVVGPILNRYVANNPPSNTGSIYATAVPTLSGSAQVGAFLYCSPGTWNGSPILTYQWYRSPYPGFSGGGLIPGATNPSYLVQPADNGMYLGCVVTGQSADGRTINSAYPAASALVVWLAPPPPMLSAASFMPGDKVTCSPRGWPGISPSYTFQFQWQISPDGGTSWFNIPGDSGYPYQHTLGSGEMGYQIHCLVSPSNGGPGQPTNASPSQDVALGASMTPYTMLLPATAVKGTLAPDGNVYFTTNPSSNQIGVYRFDTMRKSAILITTINTSAPTSDNPIACDAAGNIYVGDAGNSQVWKIPFTSPWYGAPSVFILGTAAVGLAVDTSNGKLYAVNGSPRVARYNLMTGAQEAALNGLNDSIFSCAIQNGSLYGFSNSNIDIWNNAAASLGSYGPDSKIAVSPSSSGNGSGNAIASDGKFLYTTIKGSQGYVGRVSSNYNRSLMDAPLAWGTGSYPFPTLPSIAGASTADHALYVLCGSTIYIFKGMI
jgi:hypothetical protein